MKHYCLRCKMYFKTEDGHNCYLKENKMENNKKITGENIWFLCDCWYCKIIHHPIRNALEFIDKRWLVIHEKKFKIIKKLIRRMEK